MENCILMWPGCDRREITEGRTHWRLYADMLEHIYASMRIITLTSQKGGSGKSSLASCLAVAATQSGENVLAIDCDPQGTLAEWAKIRRGAPPNVAHIPPSKLAQLDDILNSVRESYSLAIIDTAGADTPATHNAMTAADLCLVPLRPTRPDALGIKPTVDALIRGRKHFASVLNQCPTVA